MNETLTGDSSTLKEHKSQNHLSVGVIGCGYWGPKLARNFNDLPNADLAMVSDLREDRLEEIKNLYPAVTITRNYNDLLTSDIEAIVIATPVNTHYPIAKEALLAGKHVLIEKPITAHSDQARDLIEIARKKKLVLMVGHTFEYNPAVEAVHDIVQSGDLGNIYYLNSIRVNLGL
jgi:predicted dehydrogenase